MLWGIEGWSCPGDQLQRNITTLGPHGVAVDTVAEGAGKLVIIYMYLPSNWHAVAGSCVGVTAMGIKEGVCQGVFVCAHEGMYSLRIVREAVESSGRSEVVEPSPSVENRSGL